MKRVLNVLPLKLFPKQSLSSTAHCSLISLSTFKFFTSSRISQISTCRNFSTFTLQFSNLTTNTSDHDDNVKRIKELNDILELNPDLIDAMIERSKCYEQLSDWKSACVDLEKIVSIKHPPTDLLPGLLEKLFRLNTRKENYNVKRATEHYERLFKIIANDSVQIPIHHYHRLFVLYFELNLHEKALTITNEAIESLESNGNVEFGNEQADNLSKFLHRRGYLLITMYKMIDSGRKDFERSLSLSSSNKLETLLFMIDAYAQVNENELMLKTFELLKECEKNETRTDETTRGEYINLYKHIHEYFMQLEDFKNALKCLKQFYTANPEILFIYYNRYQSLCMNLGEYFEFLESTTNYLKTFGDVTQEMETQPPEGASIATTLQFTLSLSTIYFFVGRLDDSLRECEKFKVLMETPQSIFPKEHLEGLYYIISTYSHMEKGNQTQAIEFANQAKQFYPLILRDVADHNYQKGNYSTARYYYMESYNVNKDLFDLSKLVEIYIVEKDFESAIRECEKILEINPNHYQTLFSLGRIFVNLRDLKKARKYFDRALDEAAKKDDSEKLVKILKRNWPQYFETKLM